MKIICQKSKLVEGINIVQKAVSSRTTLPILECILISAKDNQFMLSGNDMELGIETGIDAEILEEGSIAIEARIFSEIIKKMPDDVIEIVADYNNQATIRCKKSKFSISGQPGDDFVKLPVISKTNPVVINQNLLKEMIRQTIFSIAVEETRPILTGELIEISQDAITFVALDGYRVAIRKNKFESPFNQKFKVVFPGKTLNEISKIIHSEQDTDIMFYFSDKHVLVEFNQTTVVSRLISGEYPDYSRMYSDDYETKMTVNRKDLLSSIERASLITRESKKEPVKYTMERNLLTVTSNTELGNVVEELDIELEGAPLKIAFNPKFFMDALKVIEDEKISILFTNEVSPCLIKPVDIDEYTYLILPVKLNHY